jgi:hypothetical protein
MMRLIGQVLIFGLVAYTVLTVIQMRERARDQAAQLTALREWEDEISKEWNNGSSGD